MTTYKVTYKGQKYELKQSLDSIFAFEEITGKFFELKTTYDLFINIFCLFHANGVVLDYNEFKNYVDDNFNFINEFYAGIVSEPEKKSVEAESDKKKQAKGKK
jgi:hypothetical protein